MVYMHGIPVCYIPDLYLAMHLVYSVLQSVLYVYRTNCDMYIYIAVYYNVFYCHLLPIDAWSRSTGFPRYTIHYRD